MKFYEIKDILNENSIIKIYDGNQEQIGCYDGKESIHTCYDEFEINDIFTDSYYFNASHNAVSAIGIELEFYKYFDGQESEI